MPVALDVTALVASILQHFFEATPFQDLKHRLKSYGPDVTDGKIEEALGQLKRDGLIEIREERVGTRTDKIIRLTGKGIKRSASAAM